MPFCLGFAVYGVGVGGVDASTNMQAVALQHRYGRSILTSFHAAWSAGGIVGSLYTAGTEGLNLPLAPVLLVARRGDPRRRLVRRRPSGPGHQRARRGGR